MNLDLDNLAIQLLMAVLPLIAVTPIGPFAIIGLAALALGYLAYKNLMIGAQGSEPEMV
jgi:hypothetical protein